MLVDLSAGHREGRVMGRVAGRQNARKHHWREEGETGERWLAEVAWAGRLANEERQAQIRELDHPARHQTG
jgi:hypothetical protein